MIKNGSEKKTRTRKKSDTLSASSKTNSNHDIKTEISQIIHFGEPFKCKTKTQKDFLNLIYDKEIIFASGPAGVGKTYISAAVALDLIKSTSTPYKQIIISKPLVEVDEELGFIPGTVREKMDPFVGSVFRTVDKLIGKPNRIILENAEIMAVLALAHMRGETIDNTIFIMDEAQNMTPKQMKTFLTRIGQNSKFIILGDLDQSDRFKNPKHSGFYQAIQIHKNIPEIGFVEFGSEEEDTVRNKIISKILKNYKADEEVVVEKPKVVLIKKKESIFTKILRYFSLKK